MLLCCSAVALSCAARPVAATAPRARTDAARQNTEPTNQPTPSTPRATPAHHAGPTRSELNDAGAQGDASTSLGTDPDSDATAACPEDMVRVTHDFCPDLERTCVRDEYERPNHLTICHEFEPGSGRCLAPRVPLDFCIDRYEFPNQKGGHPPVMVDFHDAKAACAARGKRLCLEREWTAACEGPQETPFPYGWARSSKMCNIDNRWIEPSLGAIYSKNAAVRDRELARLDQSVPSGAREGCVSGFGVHDLTGNFDEWTLADHERPRAKGKDAALKGGAWGHVRNACRPVTTSHAPEFRYYFVSFRCCADVAAVR
jgi:sulfatase modifying factor 1